ncbi:endonuclease/exonuclease/phosphatase family protein [uncultured Friedmanniella sp.]|uniref:endonuclease/exonuclease/phosphatase family protein n=1 Tax=uncultured Friedmanniella sp. TaxID=335381 RepID=UPI0035CA5EF1
MFGKLTVAVCSLALVAGLTATAAPADAAATPSRITKVKAVAGPRAGQVTISWKQDGNHTSAFKIETGLTTFSKTSKSMPRTGRDSKTFTVARTRRSVTLSAAQVASAGAGVGTGNHLYFRISAVNGGTARAYPKLQAVMPKPAAATSSGTAVRIGSFNVRTARATSDKRSWLRRAPDVARQIRKENPGVVAIQELGPGRADGKKGKTKGHTRQTVSLLDNLKKVGAGKYRLVRTTPYVKPGTTHNTQGARILYDSSRYELAWACPEKTGKKSYSSSCSLELPLLVHDSQHNRRSAAYALLENKRTGKRFWFASVHLDDRHSKNLTKEKSYNALRGRQMKAVYARIASVNTKHRQVIIAGDINSWQNNKAGNAPHDYLVSQGFSDTAAAKVRIKTQYATINHFDRVLHPAHQGYGVRIDVIMVRGGKGVKRFENVMKVVDSSRPSDHNMITSDLVL